MFDVHRIWRPAPSPSPDGDLAGRSEDGDSAARRLIQILVICAVIFYIKVSLEATSAAYAVLDYSSGQRSMGSAGGAIFNSRPMISIGYPLNDLSWMTSTGGDSATLRTWQRTVAHRSRTHDPQSAAPLGAVIRNAHDARSSKTSGSARRLRRLPTRSYCAARQVREYAIYDTTVVGAPLPFNSPVALTRADLLTLCLGVVAIVGLVLCECSTQRSTWSSAAFIRIERLPHEPMDDAFTAGERRKAHVHSDAAGLFDLSAAAAYALLRKVYFYYFFPSGSYTIFEIATGAALQVHYGGVSDCVAHKGTKYASADGIYCSGYVIAGGKFLVATEDLLTVILMKLTRLRFTNVYVHEIKDKTVEQTVM